MSIEKIKIINIPEFKDTNGILIKIESKTEINFEIKRFFQILANKGDIRGYHAHKKYYQFMFCSSGSVEVVCDDGHEKRKYLLDKLNIGLIIPPMIWCHQKYLKSNSILSVLSDGEYNEKEYLRDYKEFIKLVKQ